MHAREHLILSGWATLRGHLWHRSHLWHWSHLWDWGHLWQQRPSLTTNKGHPWPKTWWRGCSHLLARAYACTLGFWVQMRPAFCSALLLGRAFARGSPADPKLLGCRPRAPRLQHPAPCACRAVQLGTAPLAQELRVR